MTDRVILTYSGTPEEIDRVKTLFYIASVASAMGLDTAVFLFSDGVLLVKKGVLDVVEKELSKLLRDLIESNVEIYACEVALSSKGVKKEDLMNGVKTIGYATFFDLAINAKIILPI